MGQVFYVQWPAWDSSEPRAQDFGLKLSGFGFRV